MTSMLGSLPTGTTSVTAGGDSAPTASGECAPFPGLFIKDGASFKQGTESLLTASNPLPCLAPPSEDGFLWLRADLDLPAYMTVDGSERASLWINQFPPDIDAAGVNSNGVPLLASQLPVWTPSLQNGLGGLLWSPAANTQLNKVFPPGTLNEPTADGEGVTILAVVRTTDADTTGNVLTLRLDNADLEFGLRKKNFGADYIIPMSTGQDAHGVILPFTNYGNQTLLLSWVYFGAGITPEFYVNGVLQTLTAPTTGLLSYSGNSGYSVGFTAATQNCWWKGPLFEILGYRSTNPLRRLGGQTYLNTKWRVY